MGWFTATRVGNRRETFNIKSAARSLACAVSSDGDLKLLTLAKKNGNKLFARTETGAANSNYKAVFPDSLGARVLWRTEQIAQLSRDTVRLDQQGAEGKDKDILKNSYWLVCHLVFCRLPTLRLEEELELSGGDRTKVCTEARQAAQQLITEYNALSFTKTADAVFKNAADLKILKGRVMAKLANPQA